MNVSNHTKVRKAFRKKLDNFGLGYCTCDMKFTIFASDCELHTGHLKSSDILRRLKNFKTSF